MKPERLLMEERICGTDGF